MCWFRLNSAGYLFARLIFYVSRFTSHVSHPIFYLHLSAQIVFLYATRRRNSNELPIRLPKNDA
jgi:hypothetical protein